MPERGRLYEKRPSAPSPMARLIALIICAGLAWAITVALAAWLLGLLLSNG